MIEQVLYQIVMFFQFPVYFMIVSMFVYSIVDFGLFSARALRRMRGTNHPITTNPEELYIVGLKALEIPRLISRVAPLLGLVGTLIPLGPALVSLSLGNTQELGSKLSYAFGAVSLSLISASICYYTSTVRRRWLIQTIKELEGKNEVQGNN